MRMLVRGHPSPHLLDWNGDGTTDLVVSDPRSWILRIALGPLTGRDAVALVPYDLPERPDVHPEDFEFADWDGDGRFDLLVSSQFLSAKDGPWVYRIDWYRNTAPRGVPVYAAPILLLTIPAPWELNGFALLPRGSGRRPDLVASVTSNWQRPADRWTVDSHLWLYRRAD